MSSLSRTSVSRAELVAGAPGPDTRGSWSRAVALRSTIFRYTIIQLHRELIKFT